MGKVNNALRMLAIIKGRKKVTRRELAEELEVGVREITRYKEALECAGVHISEVRGRYGGYYLENKDYLLDLRLSSEEENGLNNTLLLLNSQGSQFYESVKSAIEKINIASKNSNGEIGHIAYHKSIRSKGNSFEESQKWATINDAIICSRKIRITYIDARGYKSERIIHPYSLFTYYGANFVIGFCEDKGEIRQFKLMRIFDIQKCDEKFEAVDFNVKEYFESSIGIVNSKKYNLVLKIEYPYAQSFKEFEWLNREKIEDYIDLGFIIYRAEVSGKEDIFNWIMGMGTSCEIIEPQELREEIREKLQFIINKYKI